MRWISALARFKFTVKYRPGKASTDCDYLSRNSGFSTYTEKIDIKSLSAILSAMSKCRDDLFNVNAVKVFFNQLDVEEEFDIKMIDIVQLKNEQINDAIIRPYFRMKRQHPAEGKRAHAFAWSLKSAGGFRERCKPPQ